MTTEEKNKILNLRANGCGYKKISSITGISICSIRNIVNKQKCDNAVYCKFCGKQIKQTPHKKKKEFCNDECRMKWWSAHRNLLNFKDLRTSTCACCGKSFQHHGKRERKYCCRECFLAGRTNNE